MISYGGVHFRRLRDRVGCGFNAEDARLRPISTSAKFDFLVSFAMVPKRPSEKAPPRGGSNSTHQPLEWAVGSPQELTPLAGFFDVEVSQSPNRGAAPRHRQEVTQPASSTPSSSTQWEAPPPLSPIPTQPMEPTSAPTTGDAAIPTVPPRAPPREAPSRYSQGTTQPGPPPPGASRVTWSETQYQHIGTHTKERVWPRLLELHAQYSQTGNGWPHHQEWHTVIMANTLQMNKLRARVIAPTGYVM